jgi:iron complex outermembrane receptor protein
VNATRPLRCSNDGNTDATSSYTLGNLHFGLEQRSGRVAFTEFLRVDNVTDQKYAGTVIVNESLGRYFEPSPGRNALFGANLRYVF